MPNSHVRGNPPAGQVSTSVPSHSGFDDRQLEDEIDFGVYGRILVRYWIPLVACAAAGAVIGFVVADRRPTLYEAATTIIARQGDSAVSSGSVRALLQNGTLATQTLRETGLDKPPASLSPQAFIADVRVDEVPGTNFLRITVTLPDRDKAAIASTTLARKAVDLSRQVSQEQSLAVRGQLKEQLEEAAQRLADAEQRLLSYRNEAQVEVLQRDTESLLAARDHLARLQADIEAEKGRLAAAEQEIRNHQPGPPVKRSAASEDALRRGAASDKATANSPAEIVNPDTLDLSGPSGNSVYETIALQIAMSRIRLAGLERERTQVLSAEKLGGSGVSKLSNLHRRELEFARLEGDYDLAKQVHDDLVLRYEQAPTESLSKMMNLQIVDEAIPPDRARPKKRPQGAILGTLIALILATPAAMAWESQVRSARGTQGQRTRRAELS